MMQKILRIDMGNVHGPSYGEEPLGNYTGLGGRALTSTIVSSEVPPLCHPLDAENKLVIAPGLLSGTAADMTGRLSIGFKSPLTGGIKESNAGGSASQILARLGYAALVLEGKPADDTVYKIMISLEGIDIVPDNSLKMLGNYELIGTVIEEFDEKLACISIGPAGEARMAAASIACTDAELNPTRHAGRGGGGAVMGSKGVKIIILDGKGTNSIIAKDKKRFADASQKFSESIRNYPPIHNTYTKLGTASLVDTINNLGGFPSYYFKSGKFENVEKINAFELIRLESERGGETSHGCHRGCIIRCSGIYNDPDGDYMTKQPEYETIWAHGANCGIDDMDAIAQLDQLDDDYGIDTIEMGNAIAIAMEAGLAKFGDAEKAIELVDEVGQGTETGKILGGGASNAGKVLGIKNIATVKNQSLPAYDPRVLPGLGITFSTSPMGADHTAGFVFGVAHDKDGNVNHDTLKEFAALSRKNQIAIAALDSTGLCLFVNGVISNQPESHQAMLDMINSLYDWQWTADDYITMGRSTLRKELEFNRAAGLTSSHDRLPEFFKTDPVPPHRLTFQVSDEILDSLLDDVTRP